MDLSTQEYLFLFFGLLGGLFFLVNLLLGLDFDFDADFDIDGDIDVDSDLDTDAEGHSKWLSFLNFQALLGGFIFFGLAGLAGTWVWQLALIGSLLLAVPAFLIGYIAMFRIFRFLKAQEFNNAQSERDFVGQLAKVTTAIQPGGLGKVITIGGREPTSFLATSLDDTRIDNNAEVIIVDFDQNGRATVTVHDIPKL